MSQPRMRRASTAGEVPRVRSSFVKASGDSSIDPNRQKHPRDRSKTKLPKNIRYDLDNALVGLCDVWFEDIKPYLIRNKIKVHIQGDGSSPASGDHSRAPPGAPGCSHYDPGAASDHRQRQCVSCVDYCATRQTASKARCRKPPAPAVQSPLSPLQLILQSLNVTRAYKKSNKHSNNNRMYSPRTRKRLRVQPASHQAWRPQHSRTYTVIPTKAPLRSRIRNVRSAAASYGKRDSGSQTYFKSLCMVHKATQTKRPTSPVSRNTSARLAPNIPAASFDRCAGKTTLFPTRLKSHTQSPPTLFRDSLEYSIKGANQKPLIKVLYQSPLSSKFNSSVTLLEMPRGKRKRKNAGKIPPWR